MRCKKVRPTCQRVLALYVKMLDHVGPLSHQIEKTDMLSHACVCPPFHARKTNSLIPLLPLFQVFEIGFGGGESLL